MTERRRERSTTPAEAARLFLKAVAREQGHTALALADSDGLLIADNGPDLDTEAVAAVAPLAWGHRAGAASGLLGLVTRGAPLRVWDIEMEGRTYFLAAVGGADKRPKGAARSLERILLRPSLALAA